MFSQGGQAYDSPTACAVIGVLVTMCLLLRNYSTAALAAVFFCAPLPATADTGLTPPVEDVVASSAVVDSVAAYETLAALPAAQLAGQAGRTLVVEVDLAGSPGFTLDASVDGVQARYRMAFNNVAEGWNWYPQADPRQEDYYHAKFLPLASRIEERGEYAHEDKIGTPQHMQVTWRYDYFLAFENLYDFYPRTTDDDAGFAATLPPVETGRVRMLALATLETPVTAESTTFWKATHGRPVDFTLRKRYLIGRLQAVWFVDAKDGQVLARVLPIQ